MAVSPRADSLRIASSDDGVNIVGGVDGSGFNGRPGHNDFNSSSNNHLDINGGYIYVNATGDGIDINGSVTMTGGSLIINGPTSNMNGALDYDGTFKMTGGFLVAAGSSGMAQAPSSSSTQDYLALTYASTQSAGTMIHIETDDGEDLLTFVPVKMYKSIVLCSPDLEDGMTCVVYSGGSSTGTVTDGLYSGGTYTPGTELGTVTV